ncbi:hypothetical protein LGM85_22495 [Burkholderia multivorans]|nr:hypothetical protein [Burkholderia multivorans]
MIDSPLQVDAFNREVRIRVLQCLAQDGELSIAIVGGGATGVELAAELAQVTETATSSARNISSVYRWLDIAQPIMQRLNTSSTSAR